MKFVCLRAATAWLLAFRSAFRSAFFSAFLSALLLLGGCGSGPPLTGAPAAPVDLSGHWCLVRAQLDEALDASERVQDLERQPRRPSDRVQGRLRLPLQMRVERVRIEQGRGFTRLNYGDLLVREYDWGAGNNRTVEAGWDGQVLVVRTDMGGRERLIERYRLTRDAERLLQDTEFSSPDTRNEHFTRTFERVSADVTWCRLAT